MTLGYEYRADARTECVYRLEAAPLEDYQVIRLTVSETFPQDARRGLCGKIPLWIRGRFSRHRLKKLREQTLGCIRGEIAPLLDEFGDNYLLTDDRAKSAGFPAMLSLPEFDAYDGPKWIRRLLGQAVYADFVVLGDAPCLNRILCELAPRMKTLLWIAPDRAARDQTEEFAEDFYQEYGLAMDLQFLPEDGAYSRIRIPDGHYRHPVNVLDFTGEKYLPVFSPPEGSVWLDFASLTEKERRIDARRMKVRYVSLRKQWSGRSRGRTGGLLLDTTGKNRYNTIG